MGKIITFLLYSLVIYLSVMFIDMADKNIKGTKKNYKFYIFFFISIIMPCLLAGMRGDTVGVDIKTYSKPMYELAMNMSSLFDYIKINRVEMGFSTLVYVSTKLTHSIFGVHFAIALFQILPVYFTALLYREKFPMRWPVFVYYCIFYLMGFNVMRQCISCGFILLAFVLFFKKKYLMLAVCIGIAILFHSSAAIGVAIVFCGYVLYRIKNKNVRNFIIFFVAVFLVVAIVKWEALATYLISKGYINDYTEYIAIMNGTSSAKAYMHYIDKTGVVESVYKIIFILIPLMTIVFSKRKNMNKENITVAVVCVFSVAIYWIVFLLLKTVYIYRITTFGEYFYILFIPLAFNGKRYYRGLYTTKNNLVISLLLLSYVMIAYSWLNSHGVTPFVLL